MSHFKRLRAVAPVVALIMAGGCSATGSQTAAEDGAPSPDRPAEMSSACGFGSVHDWRAIDRRSLVVWFTNNKVENARLIELNFPCDRLPFADAIAFETKDRFRVCSFGGDAVIVDGQRCSIGRVSPYDPQKHRIPGRGGEDLDEEQSGAATPADRADER